MLFCFSDGADGLLAVTKLCTHDWIYDSNLPDFDCYPQCDLSALHRGRTLLRFHLLFAPSILLRPLVRSPLDQPSEFEGCCFFRYLCDGWLFVLDRDYLPNIERDGRNRKEGRYPLVDWLINPPQ